MQILIQFLFSELKMLHCTRIHLVFSKLKKKYCSYFSIWQTTVCCPLRLHALSRPKGEIMYRQLRPGRAGRGLSAKIGRVKNLNIFIRIHTTKKVIFKHSNIISGIINKFAVLFHLCSICTFCNFCSSSYLYHM